MTTLIFDKLNFLNLSIMILFKLFGYNIFFVKISSYLKNRKFVSFLKKININWFNYQDYNLNKVITSQTFNYLPVASNFSKRFEELFITQNLQKEFYNKDYLKICLEFNLKNKIFESIELVEICNYLKKNPEKNIYIWADNDLVNQYVFKEFKVKNKNKFDLSYLSILFYVIINFFKILVKKIFFLKGRKKSGLLKKNINKNFKTIFFPHDILTSGLYKKNFFYSENSDHKTFPCNMLHVEWNNNYLSDENKKFYAGNNISYISWQNIINIEILITFLSFLMKNLKLFLRILLWDFKIFQILCVSIFKIKKSEYFFNKNSNLRYLFSGHGDLFPPEILVVSKKKNIFSISLEDRIVTSKWSSRILFDYYFTSGPKSTNYLIEKQYTNSDVKFINGFLIKSKNIKRKKMTNLISSLNCLVIDFNTKADWYKNGMNACNNMRLNNSFYELIIDLALTFKNINFLIKSKNYEWLNQPYFITTINKMKKIDNIKILEDTKKWTPEKSAVFSDFAFGLHSSIIDEVFAGGKPILIYDRDYYPSKIFDFGDELLSRNKDDIIKKFNRILNNFNEYNENLDKYRSNIFYDKNQKKFQEKLMKILKDE